MQSIKELEYAIMAKRRREKEDKETLEAIAQLTHSEEIYVDTLARVLATVMRDCPKEEHFGRSLQRYVVDTITDGMRKLDHRCCAQLQQKASAHYGESRKFSVCLDCYGVCSVVGCRLFYEKPIMKGYDATNKRVVLCEKHARQYLDADRLYLRRNKAELEQWNQLIKDCYATEKELNEIITDAQMKRRQLHQQLSETKFKVVTTQSKLEFQEKKVNFLEKQLEAREAAMNDEGSSGSS